jgi:SNF2 family DNA or RNA helicase
MIVHTPTKSLLLKVRPDVFNQLRTIFPDHSRQIDHEGHNIALPHKLSVVKVLRNMGIKAPSPIRHYYNWPRPARFAKVFDHQYATADFVTLHNKCFVLNEMGTSKTASVLWACDYLMQEKKIKKVLIVTTLSTVNDVWLNEIFSVCMHRTALILHNTAEKRKEMLARDVDFYIINHAGLQIIAKDVIARKDIDLIIVDEASTYRNAMNEQYKVLDKVIKNKKAWLLTGAPCPNAPTDAWALARLVDRSRVPDHFSQFRRMTMNQVSTYKWAPKPGSHQMAFDALQPAIRFKKADCLTLPPITFTTRACGLSAEQAKAYQQMKTHLVAEAKLQTISAVNAADKISKLRQILCGSIKDADSGQYITLDHTPRLNVLKETIEQASAKVIVVVPFKGIVHALRQELNEWHASRGTGRRVEIINGDVPAKRRSEIFQDFRDDPALNEIICHPAVMAHGLNLTHADMLIFYAPIYSNDQSGQVMDRINRPGQQLHMTIVRIEANAMERAIYAMLEGKQQSQENMLSLFKKELQL